MRVVIALGGNAILKRGEVMSSENQRANVRRAALAINDVISAGHEVVITHGNGPQVGLLALQGLAYDAISASPIDVLTAETEGMIGYMIEQELNSIATAGLKVATLLTQVEVSVDDPAFKKPSKPIGPIYDKKKSAALSAKYGWSMIADGSHFRRGVPSPAPKRILEIATIQLLIKHGVTVICVGGGGIPVIKLPSGIYIGVEAVIDKDFASALLAQEIKADALLLLTDVDGVYLGWGTEQQRQLRQVTADEIKSHIFANGSMAPKVLASLDFLAAGGKMAGIGKMEEAVQILNGQAGTNIISGSKLT
ncbi:MAG: carbamate kinase [Aestuariivirga sp.]